MTEKIFHGCHLSVMIHDVREINLISTTNPDALDIEFVTDEGEKGTIDLFYSGKPKFKGIQDLSKLKKLKVKLGGILLRKEKK